MFRFFTSFRFIADADVLRSYMEGIKRGYLTLDPTAFNDPHVCDPYVNTTVAS